MTTRTIAAATARLAALVDELHSARALPRRKQHRQGQRHCTVGREWGGRAGRSVSRFPVWTAQLQHVGLPKCFGLNGQHWLTLGKNRTSLANQFRMLNKG